MPALSPLLQPQFKTTDLSAVVTDQWVMYLKPDQKVKNVSKMIAWFSLGALEQIKRNLDNPDSITFIWRGAEGQKPP